MRCRLEIAAFQAGGGFDCTVFLSKTIITYVTYNGLFHGQCFPRVILARGRVAAVLLPFLSPDHIIHSPKSWPSRRDWIQLNVVQTVTYNHNMRHSECPRWTVNNFDWRYGMANGSTKFHASTYTRGRQAFHRSSFE